MEEMLDTLLAGRDLLSAEYIGFLRIAVPALAAILLLRCALPLLTFRREPEIWA